MFTTWRTTDRLLLHPYFNWPRTLKARRSLRSAHIGLKTCQNLAIKMADSRVVLFCDIDNCLYPKRWNVHDHMSKLIDKYFMTHLSLTEEDANKLHMEYYKTYGLAIEGLVRYHKIDPIEYNTLVDDALPLEEIMSPRPDVRELLLAVDRSKVKLWLFTNAYVTHGQRVVKLLGIDDLFEGITYCDYGAEKLLCKPSPDMYAKAMREAGVQDYGKCYFVDDSALNCSKAYELGWKTAHLVEQDVNPPAKQAAKYQIEHITELRKVFPELFQH